MSRPSVHLSGLSLMRSRIAFSVIEMRSLIALAVAASAFFASSVLPPSDFAQDYLAARAARENSDPNAPSRLLAARFGVPASAVTSVQTAHPPMVTAFALPLAGLTWPRAKAVWEFCLCAIAAVLVLCSGIRALNLALLSPAWIFGLALRNLDAVESACPCLRSRQAAVAREFGLESRRL